MGSTGRIPAAGGCEPGWHDGGDGRCVPQGSCVPGYALRFPDGDGDGVGAGVAACAPEGAPGWADARDDCDDRDPRVWRVAAEALDEDGDGYTVSGPPACVGAPSADARPASAPPVYGLAPGHLESRGPAGGNEGWTLPDEGFVDGDEARCRNRREIGCGALGVTDFGLEVPDDARILGLIVRVERRAGHVDAALADPIRVGRGADARSDLRTGDVPWDGSWTVAAAGAADDRWGLPLTPELVRDPAFGVWLDPQGPGAELRIRRVWIEVYTDHGEDCDDEDATRWSALAGFADADGDGWGGPAAVACGQAAPIEGFTQRGGDCYDGHAGAHPGAGGAHAEDRGDGSFDYDCDGVETPGAVTTDQTCEADEFGDCRSATVGVEPPAPCGAPNEINRCVALDGGCEFQSSSPPTLCR